MREKSLSKLIRSLWGLRNEEEPVSVWSSLHLNLLGEDKPEWLIWFILGWVMLSALVVLVIHKCMKGYENKNPNEEGRIEAESSTPNKRSSGEQSEISRFRSSSFKHHEPPRLATSPRSKAKESSKLSTNKVLEFLSLRQRVRGETDMDKELDAQEPEEPVENEHSHEVSEEEEEAKMLIYGHLANNLSMINANIEELSELAAKNEWNRVATAHEAGEVATLIYNQPAWTLRPPTDSDWERRFLKPGGEMASLYIARAPGETDEQEEEEEE